MKRKHGMTSAMFLIGLLVAAPAMAGPLEVFVGWLDLVCEPCNELRMRAVSSEDEVISNPDTSNTYERPPVYDPPPDPPAAQSDEASSGE
jgi:hypothetical protein